MSHLRQLIRNRDAVKLNEPSDMLDVLPLFWDCLYIFCNPRRAKCSCFS